MTTMNKHYWENRYTTQNVGWDLSEVSPPIKAYMDQIEDKSIRILIPGAGNSYEAEYLWRNGFKNVFVLDIAKSPLQNFRNRVKDFPENQLIEKDFFSTDGQYDLILEQTFFCALTPDLRKDYCEKMFHLLKPNGKMAGLLFDFELTASGPPFGGNTTIYRSLFEQKFRIKTLAHAYNSINSRHNKELFFIFEKNNNLG